MRPPAPVRFSGTTCWPRPSLIFAATMRPTTSTLPPGGKPISSFTGLTGYCPEPVEGPCASAPAHVAASRAPNIAAVVFMTGLVYPGARGPHHLPPLVGLLAHVLAELLGRLRHDVDALHREL